jgi:hypothetical protein
MRVIYSEYMDAPSDDDAINVADKNQRPQPSTPASVAADAMDSKNLAAQISKSVQELVSSDSDVSDFNLSSPLLQTTTLDNLDMGNSINPLHSSQDSAEPRVQLALLNAAEEDGSETSSPLSSLSKTPTPPSGLESSPSPQPSSSKLNSHPKVKQESPTEPSPQRLSQPPTSPSNADTKAQARKTASRRLRRTDYRLECTHTDICICPVHAAHPSVRKTSAEKATFPHFGEWALGMMEWPESAMRSSIEREMNWRDGLIKACGEGVDA